MTAELANDDPQFAFNFADRPDDTKKDEGQKAKEVECTKKKVQAILDLQEKERAAGAVETRRTTMVAKAHGRLEYSAKRPNKDDWMQPATLGASI
jgi:hypothetical protein